MENDSSFNAIQVTYLETDKIMPAKKNPRRHSPVQIKQLIKSIKSFNFVVPIVVDQHGEIIAGHARYAAARKLGMPTIPVVRLEHLTDSQVKALRIADNQLTDLSEWDNQILAETLRDLSNLDLDFDLEATGFATTEIDLRIEDLSIQAEASDAADALPEPSSEVPISRHGDKWVCERHVIMCADSRSSEVHEILFENA